MGDRNGHGTHVAGIAAALDNGFGTVGVAPGARLHSLKVLNQQGEGYLSWGLAAIDYMTQVKMESPQTTMVANMSLGFYSGTTSYNALDDAVAASVESGIVFCVAAGNDSMDASLVSPAHVSTAITVGSSGQDNNAFSAFSNYGSRIDVCAPGEDIYSTWLRNDYRLLSGTSMACPHVAGAVALHLWKSPRDKPARVREAIMAYAKPLVTNTPPHTTHALLSIPSEFIPDSFLQQPQQSQQQQVHPLSLPSLVQQNRQYQEEKADDYHHPRNFLG